MSTSTSLSHALTRDRTRTHSNTGPKPPHPYKSSPSCNADTGEGHSGYVNPSPQIKMTCVLVLTATTDWMVSWKLFFWTAIGGSSQSRSFAVYKWTNIMRQSPWQTRVSSATQDILRVLRNTTLHHHLQKVTQFIILCRSISMILRITIEHNAYNRHNICMQHFKAHDLTLKAFCFFYRVYLWFYTIFQDKHL
jgi:hypothetical protein